MLVLSKIYTSDYIETHYELTDDVSGASSVFVFNDLTKIAKLGKVKNIKVKNHKLSMTEDVDIEDIGLNTSKILILRQSNKIESNVNPLVELKGLDVQDDKLHIIKCNDDNYYFGCKVSGTKVKKENFLRLSKTSLIGILNNLGLLSYHEEDTFGVSNETLHKNKDEYELLQQVLRDVCAGINDNLRSDKAVQIASDTCNDTFNKVEAVYNDSKKTIIRVRDLYGNEARYFSISNMDMICTYASCDGVIDLTNEPNSYLFTLGEYPRIGYNELMMWIGNFKYILEDKWLKYKYIMYNKKYFDNVLSNKTILFKTNYNGDDTEQSDFLGYKHEGIYNIAIYVNSKYFDITSGRTDLHLKCTLLHEMCHSAAGIKYGTIEENEGEDAETLGYINKRIVRYLKKIDCYDQIYYHGKKFMSVVKEVSKRAKLHVGDVYGYGREIDLLAYKARENITLNSLDKKRPLIKFRVNDVIRYIVNYINDYNNLYKNEGIIFGAAKSDNRGIISVTSTVMNKRYMIEKSDWHDVKIFALRGDDAEHCKLCAVVDTYSYDKVKDIADSIIRYIIRDV